MNKPKVSIVVPIYGVEKYLHQCVDSILAQTLKDIEIILVDDGSKDKCPEIVDEYAKKDPRVVAVHQPNGGYGRAVNHGIELATGEYIGIVEPDDFIESDMYETLYNDAKKHDVDVVKGIYNNYWDNEDGSTKCEIAGHDWAIRPPYNPFSVYEYAMVLQYHASIWTAIYRTDFIRQNNIKVLEINKGRYADQNWRYETLMLANKIYWEHKPFYNYRLTNENASSVKKNNPDDVFDIYDELNKFFQKYPEKYEKIKDDFYAEMYRHMMWNWGRVDNKYYFYCMKRINSVFKKMDKNIVMNSTHFSKDEKDTFLKLADPNFKLKFMTKQILQNIFSIKNSSSKKHKVIRILGIKISIRRRKKG
ncbi:MAG: glycosyltransferase [Alphaproteobacteria bacterium]|nr:glycosyltransferase [Alphaproteobacteria bacterium]